MDLSNVLDDIREFVQANVNQQKFIPGKTYIHASGPKLDPEDFTTLTEAVLNGWYTEYTFAHKFAEKLKTQQKKEFAVLCNSGSSASLLAITACKEYYNLRKNDLVVTCAMGFPTTVSPIYQNELVPYYIDVIPETLSPDLEQLDEVLYNVEDIFGIILAHNLGFPFDEWEVSELNKKYYGGDLFFIADCCDAIEATFIDNLGVRCLVGTYSDVQTHSFFPAHGITTGEGGAVLTNDEDLDRIMRSLSSWGKSCDCLPGQDNTCGHRFDYPDRGKLPEGWDHKYIFDRLGYNLKMTDLQAALGYSQIQRLPEFVKARINNYHYLRQALHQYRSRISFVEWDEYSKPVPFGFPIYVREDAGFTVNDIVRFLESRKVGTRRFFGGNLTKQPGFMNLPYQKMDLSGTDYVMNQGFWVGVQPHLTQEMLDYMIEQFEEFFKQQ